MIDRAAVVRIVESVISELKINISQTNHTTKVELLYGDRIIDTDFIDNRISNETDPLKK